MTMTLMFVVLALALMCGVPIAVSLAASGSVGILMVYGFSDSAILLIPQTIHETLSNLLLASLPLYMFMAYVMVQSGMARDLFDLAERAVRRLPGGLIIAGILTSGGFAAIAGSTTATVSTVGGVALPEMLRRGYPRKISAGALAMAGTLGILIPPSALLILYAFVSGASVGDLFSAGVVPGIMLMLMMSAYVVIHEVVGRQSSTATGNSHALVDGKRPVAVGAAVGGEGRATGIASEGRTDLTDNERDRLDLLGSSAPEDMPPSSVFGVLMSLAIIPLIVSSIYFGWVTPVESAALGTLYAVCLGLAKRRLTMASLYQAVRGAASTGAMILTIIAGAGLFSKAATLAQFPMTVANSLRDADLSKAGFIALMVLIFFALGTFLDGTALISAVIPVLLPILAIYEVDLVWFGILLIMSVEIGAVTPPLGVSLLVLRSIRPDYTDGEIIKGATPFALIGVLAIVLVAVFPAIAIWLPGIQ